MLHLFAMTPHGHRHFFQSSLTPEGSEAGVGFSGSSLELTKRVSRQHAPVDVGRTLAVVASTGPAAQLDYATLQAPP